MNHPHFRLDELPVASSLLATIQRHAAEQPAQRALIFLDGDGAEKRVATFAELVADIRRAAWVWRQQGAQPRDVVLLALDHSYELVISFLGALYAGAVPVILPYSRTRHLEVVHQRLSIFAEHTQAPVAFVTPAIATLAANHGKLAALGCAVHAFAVSQASLPPVAFEPYTDELDKPLYLQMTSGTTGMPKLAKMSQRAVMLNIQHTFAACYRHRGSVVVGCMPFSHDAGLLFNLLIPLAAGLISVHISPFDWVAKPDLLWQAITTYQGAVTFLPNFALNFMVRYIPQARPEVYRLHSLDTIIVIAELITAASIHNFARHFAPCGLKEHALCGSYGMAEQVCGISFGRFSQPTRIDWVDHIQLRTARVASPITPVDERAHAVVSCGYPLPGVEIRIVDPTHQPLPERMVGEIWLQSAFGFLGYYGHPDLTARVLHDGWYATGDLGYLADGEIFVLGRQDDLIIVAGENIQPQAIEEIALGLLGTRGRLAAAFPVRDEALGTQLPVLVCEVRNLEAAEQLAAWRREIIQQVQDRLDITLAAVHFVPAGWIILSDAKIGRSANRDKYLAERLAAVPNITINAQLTPTLTALAASMIGVTTLQPDDNFFVAGSDSLTVMRFVIAVEAQVGRAVPTVFFRQPTIAHLVALLTEETHVQQTEMPALPPPATASLAVLLGGRTYDGEKPVLLPPAPASRSLLTVISRVKRQIRRSKSKLTAMPHHLRLRLRRVFEAQVFRQSYFAGTAWLMHWCKQKPVQTLLYPQDSQLVRRFAKHMGTAEVSIEREVQLHLVSRILFNHCHAQARIKSAQPSSSLSRWYTELQQAMGHAILTPAWCRYFHLLGGEHLTSARTRASGTILVNIHTYSWYAGYNFTKHLSPLFRVSEERYRQVFASLFAHTGIPYAEGRQAARTAVALDAHQMLIRGGSVVIAGDEEDPKHGLPVTVGNRVRHLVTGFADLAVTTGATLLPIYTELLGDGRIQILILPALTWDTTHSHADQVAHIMQTYGAILTLIWRQKPSVGEWVNMHHQLTDR